MSNIGSLAGSGTEITRFNALRHGVLSRYTVLPWENADEYEAIVVALVAEHAPQGPTEEHLVEEIAGILWRKRRLRLAEAAAHRRGLDGTLASYRETVKVALVHLDTTGQSERVVDAIRATAADTEEDMAEMAADESMTRRAIHGLRAVAVSASSFGFLASGAPSLRARSSLPIRPVWPMRRFPPPWTVEEIHGGLVVRDANGQSLAYVYGHADPRDAGIARR
jgi:hypothetical protein